MKVQLELSYRDLTMVYTYYYYYEACKSFLFIEGSLKVENKEHLYYMSPVSPVFHTEVTVSMVLNIPQAGFNPPGEKWQLCLNIAVALPPKAPWLDYNRTCFKTNFLREERS